MGTGIGIKCRRCGNQLNYDDGFDYQLQLCDECASITKYQQMLPDDISSFDTRVIIEELTNRLYWYTFSESDKIDIIELAESIKRIQGS